MTTATEKSGWSWPLTARKAHYFTAGQSLCGGWTPTGTISKERVAGPTCCSVCEQQLRALGGIK
jgi:hypothetical protein